MKSPFQKVRANSLRRAFSLIEVVLALGVVSFALVPLLALMPIGLGTLRESMEATVQTDVTRQLVSELRQTPYNLLVSSSSMQYFSEQGAKVADQASALLGMQYTVSTTTPLLSDGNYLNSHLKTVNISFYSRGDLARSPQKPSIRSVIFVPAGTE